MSKSVQTSITIREGVFNFVERIAQARPGGVSISSVINTLLLDAANNLYAGGLVKLMQAYQTQTGKNPLEDQDGFTSFKNEIEQNRCPSGFFAEMVKDGYMAKITTRIK